MTVAIIVAWALVVLLPFAFAVPKALSHAETIIASQFEYAKRQKRAVDTRLGYMIQLSLKWSDCIEGR